MRLVLYTLRVHPFRRGKRARMTSTFKGHEALPIAAFSALQLCMRHDYYIIIFTPNSRPLVPPLCTAPYTRPSKDPYA